MIIVEIEINSIAIDPDDVCLFVPLAKSLVVEGVEPVEMK